MFLATKNIRNRLLAILDDRRGGVAVTFAFSLIALLGVTGMSIDGGRAIKAKSSLQDAADAAALAAVSAFEAKAEEQVQIARDVFAANLNQEKSGVSSTPSVAVDGDTVTVSASATVPTLMLGVMDISNVDVGATAVARKPRDVGSACVLSLNRSSDRSLSLEGQSRLTASGCVVHSNSRSDSALSSTGSTRASADAHCAVGEYTGPGFVPTPYNNCFPVQDPFASLGSPLVSGCDYTGKVFSSGAHNATPGTYCGGLTIQSHANVTLAPGIYIIKDGPLTARAHSSISGSGVVFYLTGNNAYLDIRSGSSLDLSAPTSGPYAGLVFVQHRNSSVGQTSLIEGGGTIRIVGGFYLPTQILDVAGEGDIGALSPFMPIIANDVTLRGNAALSVKINNTIAGMPDFLPTVWAGMPRLIN